MKNIADFPSRELTLQTISVTAESAAFLVEALSQIAAKGPQAHVLADLYAQAKNAAADLSKKDGT